MAIKSGNPNDKNPMISRHVETIFRGMLREVQYVVELYADGKRMAVAEWRDGKELPFKKPVPIQFLIAKPVSEGAMK